MQPLRVTIVDDDDLVRQLVRWILEAEFPGAQVVDFPRAEEAHEYLTREGSDLVVTDYNMPGLSGPMLVKALRDQHFEQPIIMMSGSLEGRVLAEDAGIDRFIDKLQLMAELPGSVRKLLKQG